MDTGQIYTIDPMQMGEGEVLRGGCIFWRGGGERGRTGGMHKRVGTVYWTGWA
jgi:hypothetical protein